MNILTLVLAFVKTNWKQVALCVVIVSFIIFFFEKGKHYGKLEADNEWTEAYNATIEASNNKIRLIEDASIKSSRQLHEQLDDTKKKLEGLLTLPTTKIVYRDKAGKPLKCLPTVRPSTASAPEVEDAEIYLGEDFAVIWNSLNVTALGESK